MRPIRLLSALAGAALVLTTLAAVPPAGAAGTGTLVVEMVDEHGDPMPGQITVADGDEQWDETFPQVASHEVELPVGEYGVFGLSPWGGLLCVGLEPPCDYVSLVTDTVEPDGSVVVREGQRTRVVLRAEKPATLSRRAVIGKPVSLDWSDGMQSLIDFFRLQGGGVYLPVVQWQRNGTPIDGAVGETYVPVGADAGQRLSARVGYQTAMALQWQAVTGEPVEPRVIGGPAVGKVSTRSFASLANPRVPADRRGRVRVDVTARQLIVTGKVRIDVGSWTRTLTLRNGTARTILPKLRAGRHEVETRFLGSRSYAPSRARTVVLTVTR